MTFLRKVIFIAKLAKMLTNRVQKTNIDHRYIGIDIYYNVNQNKK